jgi:hypothetical protein
VKAVNVKKVNAARENVVIVPQKKKVLKKKAVNMLNNKLTC